jgi:hypothetical protein
LVLMWLLPLFLQAQVTSLKGTVADSITHLPLPYVTIIINNDGSVGTSTDSMGNYSIVSAKPISSLTLSYVGYETRHISFSKTDKNLSSFEILLSPRHAELENVVVIAGENPANRIIKAAVKNREVNNYANLNSYTYRSYEKFVFSGLPPEEDSKDSLKIKLYDYLEDHHILIMEAVIERKHLEPDLTKETVIAQKVSGLQNPNFTVLTSELQTTNFYKPFINIATTDFVNPISVNSWDKYFFNIIDTLYEGSDTTFVITYEPGKGKHFTGLKGTLQINTDGYAIQSVTAQPADTVVTTMYVKIEQRYAKVDSTHWFPTQLNTEVAFKKFFFEGLRVVMAGKTYITDPVINPPLTKKDFDGVGIDMMDDAAKKSTEFWEMNRADTLSAKEKLTYVKVDSFGKAHHLDAKLSFANALQDGNFKLPYVSIQLYNVIKINRPEGVRLGMGLETNSDLSRKYKVGGFAGYGVRDEVWKYGGFFEWKVYAPKNVKLKIAYSKNYEESGGSDFFQSNYAGSGESTRNYTITNFDLVDRKEFSFTSRIRKYVNFQFTTFATNKKPTSDYEFLNNSNDEEPQLMNDFNFAGFKAAVRFSYKERIVESLDRYYWINMGYPTVWLQVTQTIDGFLNGQFTYTKYETRFKYTFPTKSLGLTTVTLQGGWVNQVIPATDLFTGKSSYTFIGLYAPGSFQTMRSGEFLSDGYASLFFAQDFQTNVLRWGKFQPNFVFVTNIGWGTISHPEVHEGKEFKSMEKGYFESGLIINNLVARKFFGVTRLGLGAGAFYRYGAYAFSNPLDNLAIKVTWSYNFK